MAESPARRRTDRGAVLAIVALSIVALLTMSAIAVDLGRQMLRRREAQAAADVVALDLVRFVDGRTTAAIESDPDWLLTRDAAAARNSYPASQLTPELGLYDPANDVFTPTTGGQIPDAVRVTAVGSVEFFFGRVIGRNSGDVIRPAIASQSRAAGFGVGSFAAAISPCPSPPLITSGCLLNTLLQDALDVSVVSYEGLASANVTLREVALILGFTTPEELFTSSVSYEDFYLATAEALRRGGDTANATLLETVVAQANASGTFPLDDDFPFSEVVQVTTPGEEAALDASTNVLDLLAATAFIARGDAGLGLPSIALNVPGLAAANGSLTVIEPPQFTFGPVGSTARTSQVDLTLTSSGNVALGVLLPVAQVSVSLSFETARSLGTSTQILCTAPQQLDVLVESALVDVTLTITVDLPLLPPVPLVVSTSPPSTNDTATFTVPPSVQGSKVETGSGSVQLSGLSVTGGGGLGSLLAPVMSVIVNPLVAALDANLLGPLTDLVGVNVGGADVFFDSITCQPPDLVD